MNTTDEPEQVGTSSFVGLWGWIRRKLFITGIGLTIGFLVGAIIDGIVSHPLLFGISITMIVIGHKPNVKDQATDGAQDQ